MGIKRVCDCCGKESPTKDGLYIDNHWITITFESPRLYTPRQFQKLICQVCAVVFFEYFGLEEAASWWLKIKRGQE